MVEAEWMLTEADVKHRRRRRAGVRAVVAAVLANLAIWIVVEVGFGTDLRAPASGGATEAPDITPSHVVIATLVASLGAWGLLAVLERITRRAGAVWLSVSSVALVVSLGGPMSGTGISAGNRMVLLLMHLMVAAVVIPMLARTSPTPPLADERPSSAKEGR